MSHEEGLTPLQLIKWIRTRWGSMYDLIDRILVTRPVSCVSYYWSDSFHKIVIGRRQVLSAGGCEPKGPKSEKEKLS